MVDINNLFSSQSYLNWNMLNKFYAKPQMSTPDDPVIHSPPSLGGQLMSGYNPSTFPKTEDQSGVNSPEGSSMDPNGDAEARRRQKTCRVCGDHATGYNFNVITCESCKAFFRRNALRPKEFKCPYSEDCEINAVSRRFCQKCRLRKCFAVGMKKEWILNEEQLRRRKNSRLNNLATQQRQKQPYPYVKPGDLEIVRQQALKSLSSPLSISPMDAQLGALNQRQVTGPMISPQSQGFQYPLMSPAGSGSSDSPPSRPSMLMGNGAGQRSPDAYESNLMRQQRLRAEMGGLTATSGAPVQVDPAKKQVVMSMDAYQNLVEAATKVHGEEPPNKRSIFGSPNELTSRPFGGTPMMQSPTTPSLGARSIPQTPGMNTYMDISGSGEGASPSFGHGSFEEMRNKMRVYFDATIKDALDSPDTMYEGMHPGEISARHTPRSSSDTRMNYQLNATECRALDSVREAFKGMNDEMEPGKSKQSFLKSEKAPSDIMNIMDVAMRRLVKMAKKLPAFNDLSQDGKFALLKGGMIEMLTMRGVARYDPGLGVWKSPTLSEPAEVSFDRMFEKLNKEVRVQQRQRVLDFFKIFHEDIRKNELAISLISLMVLFSPRDIIIDENDKKIIAKYHEEYSSLLHRYLESLYGEDANRLTEHMPQAMKMLREISQHSGMLFLGTVNPIDAAALPREILKVE